MEHFSIKVGVSHMNVHILKQLKEELAGLYINGFELLVIKCYLKQLYH